MPQYIQMKTGSSVLPTTENEGERSRRHLVVLHLHHGAYSQEPNAKSNH